MSKPTHILPEVRVILDWGVSCGPYRVHNATAKNAPVLTKMVVGANADKQIEIGLMRNSALTSNIVQAGNEGGWPHKSSALWIISAPVGAFIACHR